MRKFSSRVLCALVLSAGFMVSGCKKSQVPGQEGVCTDLSAASTANCYIVSSEGKYSFNTTKGNSNESVGAVAEAEVLWETFGTDTAPSVGDLVKNVSYEDGKIAFEASDKKGNAVIAAKDASGKILWSWHIWLTDQPKAQVYKNNAGTMMDRNLGAISATPGDIGALGLLYQWGRKDPFLGSSVIDEDVVAKSTISWPAPVESNSSTGTVDYVIVNPTTYIYAPDPPYDWHYSSRNNDLWKSEKTIYDPCPAGWRVPDGGDEGVWSTVFGSSEYFNDKELYDHTNAGVNFSGMFGEDPCIWYPSAGYYRYSDGTFINAGHYGIMSSVTNENSSAKGFLLYYNGDVMPSYNAGRVSGYSVRCLQIID